MADSESTNKRVVRVLSARYFDPGIDPLTGDTVRFVRTAQRGAEIELVEAEEQRLDDLKALMPKGAKPEDAAAEQEAVLDLYRGQRGDTEAMRRAVERAGKHALPDTTGGIDDVSGGGGGASEQNVGQLADRISEEKLTADDTVALAGDDPAKAKRVLEAERLASGGKPRAGVEGKLQKIIDGD